MALNIIEFLTARLDEDEQIAKVASSADGDQWTAVDPFYGDSPDRVEGSGDGAIGYDMAETAPPHIARHDPARVLREVAAKRHLIEQHVSYYGDGEDDYFPVSTLSTIAGVYADHPDFDQQWAI